MISRAKPLPTSGLVLKRSSFLSSQKKKRGLRMNPKGMRDRPDPNNRPEPGEALRVGNTGFVHGTSRIPKDSESEDNTED